MFKLFCANILAQQTIILQVVSETPIGDDVVSVTTIQGKVYDLRVLTATKSVVNIHKTNDTEDGQNVVVLPVKNPVGIVGSNSDRALLVINKEEDKKGIFKLTFNGNNVDVEPWSEAQIPVSSLTASPDGRLLLVSNDDEIRPVIKVLSNKGDLLHEVNIISAKYEYRRITSAFLKSNGHIVLVATTENALASLLQVDLNGRVVREYKKRLNDLTKATMADGDERVLLSCLDSEVVLLDREFNRMEYTQRFPGHLYSVAHNIQYDNYRGEVLVMAIKNGALNNTVLIRLKFMVNE